LPTKRHLYLNPLVSAHKKVSVELGLDQWNFKVKSGKQISVEKIRSALSLVEEAQFVDKTTGAIYGIMTELPELAKDLYDAFSHPQPARHFY
jgi:hypothetical protein